jgi:hypothetical protein
MRQVARILAAAIGLVLASAVAAAVACPFCSAVSQTFSEEIATMDVAVIAKLTKAPKQSDNPGDELTKATFEITQVMKGDGLVKVGDKVETLYFGESAAGKSFLIMGIDPPQIMWSTPLPLSERAQGYLSAVLKLPKDDAERLVFFQKYLEDEDELLARDSYDEFARAPYDHVKAIKQQMDHAQIVAWIKNPEVPASRRRLYLVMLGVSGDEKDLPMLEEFMRSSDRKAKSGLDALIACYLTLKGEAGLPLVEELFLANKQADYADTYSAIMAIRFHGTEGGVIDKKPLVKSLHHMLERPELADLVIPDLARWEDWEAVDQLMELYKSADEKSSWVRVPVVNYLRACPLPRAKELLKECEKIDPAAYKRATTWFPSTPSAAPVPTPEKASSIAAPTADSKVAASSPIVDERTADEISAPQPVAAAPPGEVLAVANSAMPIPPDDEETALLNQGAAPAAAIRISPAPPANLWLVLGVPWAVGLVLLAAQWSVLRWRF